MNDFIHTLSLNNRTLSLTREGLGFILLLFGVGLGAINTGNNLLYLVLAMCCSFIAVSGLLSELSFKNLSVNAKGPAHLYCNETGTLDFKITNKKVWAPSFSIHIELSSDGRCSLEQPPYFFFIPGGTSLKKSALFHGNKRGPLQINSCLIATRFPFGFYYKTKTLPLNVDMVIFPALHPEQLPNKNDSGQEGEGTLRTRGEEIFGIREFRPGDPINSVHWKSSAKTGNLRVKEFQGTNEQNYTVFLNIKESGKNVTVKKEILEQRVNKAASLVFHLIKRGNEVSLKTEDDQTEFGKSESHLKELMYMLAFIGLDEN